MLSNFLFHPAHTDRAYAIVDAEDDEESDDSDDDKDDDDYLYKWGYYTINPLNEEGSRKNSERRSLLPPKAQMTVNKVRTSSQNRTPRAARTAQLSSSLRYPISSALKKSKISSRISP